MAKKRNRREPSALVATPPEAAAPAIAARPWLWPLITFVALLALYIVTLAPGVVGGDSGELVSASATGGVPHPPGYPLYALLARVLASLPLGHSVAWRVNLLSALATAGAAAFICATVEAWTLSAAAGLVAAALFGTDPLVWHHATAAEVFGLNAFFVALAFFLWLRVEQAISRRRVYVLCLACGLAMSNHHTFVFVGLPLVLRTLWLARRSLGWAGAATAIACGLAGLLPYAYLVVASASSTVVSWGNQTSLDGLLGHILRRDYGTFSLGEASDKGEVFVKSGTFLPTLGYMLGGSFRRLLFVGPLFALIGFVVGRRPEQRVQRWMLGGILICYALVFSAMSNLSTAKPLFLYVLSRFFIQFDVLLALAAGIGVATLASGLTAHQARLLSVLTPALFVSGVATNWSEGNQRNNTVFRDFVTAAFASLPANSILVSMGDHLSGALIYFHEVEKQRPDVIHLDRELLGYPWYCARKKRQHPDLHLPAGTYSALPGSWKIQQLIDANPQRSLAVLDRLEEWDQSWKKSSLLVTIGPTHYLVSPDRYPRFEEWAGRDQEASARFDPLPALRYPAGSWERQLAETALNAQAGRANVALLYGAQPGAGPAPAVVARRLLEQVLRYAGGSPELGIVGEPGLPATDISALGFKNLGIAYQQLMATDGSNLERAVKAFQEFVKRAKPTDSDLSRIREFLLSNHRAIPESKP